MSKFGQLIDSELPILLDFYTEWNESSSSMHPVLNEVAAAIGDKGKVIKINVDKNNINNIPLCTTQYKDTPIKNTDDNSLKKEL